ncbi:hypothetical protein MPTK1_6g18610 [Marchantia polymorpha subsp. ruderalis]|uniref:Uncharacterized protein n=2 Tax=Marchantia polymorpha TaxID=3197 RepID=A0AAF6BTH9_MARPO|nr:hypothetical protein MARPO_0038s0071 [Marchantia polymorpha]BBN15313.1 hypothetical protein Mp_6g18610 [Marchantia polymorpha subsp. ruderalis]|eukprot:PTQ40746.1 hypothetical protein MARPO_0038s0071 [Marchantia polymorpha]
MLCKPKSLAWLADVQAMNETAGRCTHREATWLAANIAEGKTTIFHILLGAQKRPEFERRSDKCTSVSPFLSDRLSLRFGALHGSS